MNNLVKIQEKILRWANGHKLNLVFASTTGNIVRRFLRLVESENIQTIVITHGKFRHPGWKRFDPKIKKKLENMGGVVLKERTRTAILRAIRTILAKYPIGSFGMREKIWEETMGIGGRVCIQMTEIAIKEKKIQLGELIVDIAGKGKGFNTIIVTKVIKTKPPRMALMDVITRDDPFLNEEIRHDH